MDRLKSRYHGGSEWAKKVGPGQLARDVGKRLSGAAKYAKTGEADPHKFAGSGEYQSAKTERAIGLYRKKLLAMADELENDIEEMGIDPGVFGVLPATLKDLAVNFHGSEGGAAVDTNAPDEASKAQISKETPLSINTRQKGVKIDGKREVPLNLHIQKVGLDAKTSQKIARGIGDYLKQREIPIAEALDNGFIDNLVEGMVQHIGVNGLLLEDTVTNMVRKSILGQMQSLLQPKAKEETKDRGAKMVLAMHGLAKSGDVEKFRNTILKWATRTGKGSKIGGWIRGNEKAQKEFADLPPEEIKQLMNSLLVDDKFNKYHQAGLEWRKGQKGQKAAGRDHLRGVGEKADAGILGKVLARYVSDNQELLGDKGLKGLFNDTAKFSGFVDIIRKKVASMMVNRGYDEAEIGKLLENLK